MKKLFLISMFALTLLFSCEEKKDNQTSHEVQWSEDKKDSVVYVTYQKQDGTVSNFYMNYLLYHNLYNNGGYKNVYHYYNRNPSKFSNSSSYSNYHKPTPVIPHVYPSSRSTVHPASRPTSRPTSPRIYSRPPVRIAPHIH